MDAATLYKEISKVCPVITTTCLEPDERNTWSYLATPEATPAQITAADNVIATIPMASVGIIPVAEFLGRWTNQEYLKLEQKRAADIAAAKIGNAKNWDIILFAHGNIDMSRQKAQTLKADLVTDGVLTQARADEIFK